jgi:TonB family protein
MPSRFTLVFLIALFVLDNAADATAAEPSDKSSKLDAAVLVTRPDIEYPYWARRQRITGSGVIIIQVDRGTGKVTDARMLQSTGSSILDNASVSGFLRARFKPGTVSQAKIPITFAVGRPPVFEYRVKQKPMEEALAHFLGKGVVLKGPIPAYPRFPPWTEKQGQGVYELHVQKDGAVTAVKILKRSGDDRFDRVAIGTLRKWRLRRGPLILELPLSFRLTPTSYSVVIPKKH